MTFLEDLHAQTVVALEIDQENSRGKTPLWVASRHNNGKLVDELLARGARTNVQPYKNPNPYDNSAHPRSLLQVLIDECDPNGWAMDLVRRICAEHPDCWKWAASDGRTIKQWVSDHDGSPGWKAFVLERQLNEAVAPASAPTRAAPRL